MIVQTSRINVSIVTYKTDLNELERCFNSLRSVLINKVIVVDNSSEKSIEEFCSKVEGVELTYIPHQNNGYGAAHNVAIKESLSDKNVTHHLILNSDVYFEPDLIEDLIERVQSPSDSYSVGMIQPRLTNSDGSPQFTARMLPSPFDLIVRRFLPKSWFRTSRNRYLLKDLDLEKEINVPYLQGSFMLFDKNVFIECGLFDERFFMYPEDIDITRRVHRKYLTLYYPKCTAIHEHRRGSYKSFKMLKIHCVNMIKYFNKWGWIIDDERLKFNHDLRK